MDGKSHGEEAEEGDDGDAMDDAERWSVRTLSLALDARIRDASKMNQPVTISSDLFFTSSSAHYLPRRRCEDNTR
jgi:hypothetical protein